MIATATPAHTSAPGCLISNGSMPHCDGEGNETGKELALFTVDQPGAIWHRGTFAVVIEAGDRVEPAALAAEFIAFQTRFTAAHA